MSESILATNQYRTAVAAAAAGGAAVEPVQSIGFGTGTTPPSVTDTVLETEILRKDLDSVVSDGVMLTVKGTLLGAEALDAEITEVGVFTVSGMLIGRRVFNPKQLEAESDLEFTLDFQF